MLKMCQRLQCFSLQPLSLTTHPAYLPGSTCAKWAVKQSCYFKQRGCAFCFASHAKTAKPISLFQLGKRNETFVFSPYFFFSNKVRKLSAKRGNTLRCSPAKAAELKNKNLMEWEQRGCCSFCCFLNASHMHPCYLNVANSYMDYNGKYFLRLFMRFVSPTPFNHS